MLENYLKSHYTELVFKQISLKTIYFIPFDDVKIKIMQPLEIVQEH